MTAILRRTVPRAEIQNVMGPGIREAMAVVQVAMAAGLPYTALRDMVLTHPTNAKEFVVLFSAVPAVR